MLTPTAPDTAVPGGDQPSLSWDGLNWNVNVPKSAGALRVFVDGVLSGTVPTSVSGIVQEQGVATKAITSGALPTIALSSTVGAQVSTTRDVDLVVSCATTSAAGTVTVALSPDGTTYSTLVVVTPAVSLVTFPVPVTVPAGWYVKLTTSNATIGTGTYY